MGQPARMHLKKAALQIFRKVVGVRFGRGQMTCGRLAARGGTTCAAGGADVYPRVPRPKKGSASLRDSIGTASEQRGGRPKHTEFEPQLIWKNPISTQQDTCPTQRATTNCTTQKTPTHPTPQPAAKNDRQPKKRKKKKDEEEDEEDEEEDDEDEEEERG